MPHDSGSRRPWALQDRWAHYAEHLTFFVTAPLFWWPVIGGPPLPSPLS